MAEVPVLQEQQTGRFLFSDSLLARSTDMHDLIVQILGYLRGIWRFRWWILGIAWITAVVGWVMIAKMPDQYQASAKVYVDTQSVLKPLLRGLAVSGSERQRLLLMTRTLMSRPNLEKLMRMSDLDLRARSPGETEAIIDELKENIELQSTRDINLYTISIEDSDPDLAKLLVKSLLTIFVESSLGESRKDQDSARQFLQQQIAEYEQRLLEAEERQARFKSKNLAFISGKGDGYYSQLQQNQAQLQQAKLDLKIQRDRLQSIKEQMEDAEGDDALYDDLLSTDGMWSSVYDARIAQMETNLDELLLRYTDKHPDVVGTKRAIEELEAKRGQELEEAFATGDDDGLGGQSNNPIYQQLRITYADAKANVAANQAIVEEYEDRIDRLEEAVDKALKVESEEKQLNRDYGLLKSQHQKLLASLESARMTRDVDTRAGAVRFRVVEPPRVPTKPSGPPRVLYSSGILIAGLALGVFLAFFISQLRPTFDDRRTLNEFTDLPVLGSVSMVWTHEQVKIRKRRHYAFLLTLLLLISVYGVVSTVFVLDVDVVSYFSDIRRIAGI